MRILLLLMGCQPLDFSNDLADDNDGDGHSEFQGDCDDSDPEQSLEDKDGDGVSSCEGDCNDRDALLNLDDLDGDGFSTCDGDCRDEDDRFQADNCPIMIEIPSGTFVMGSPPGEIGRGDDEVAHSVTLTNDFEIMSTEVTQGLYKILVGDNPTAFPLCGDKCAVDNLNWHTAAYAANAMSDLDGYEHCYDCTVDGAPTCTPAMNPYECDGYRLPTEAEWEFAARFSSEDSFWTPLGGGELPAFAGVESSEEGETLDEDQNVCDPQQLILSDNTPLSNLGWFCGNNPAAGNDNYGVKEVGVLTPNGFGLYDMHGNLYEWVHDSYGPYDTDGVTDPTGPTGTNFKGMRGGFWGGHPKDLRSANRFNQTSTQAYPYYGFRLARTLR